MVLFWYLNINYNTYKCSYLTCNVGNEILLTYTRHERSAKWSTNSNSWVMSYVIDTDFGFNFFKCSS